MVMGFVTWSEMTDYVDFKVAQAIRQLTDPQYTPDRPTKPVPPGYAHVETRTPEQVAEERRRLADWRREQSD